MIALVTVELWSSGNQSASFEMEEIHNRHDTEKKHRVRYWDSTAQEEHQTERDGKIKPSQSTAITRIRTWVNAAESWAHS